MLAIAYYGSSPWLRKSSLGVISSQISIIRCHDCNSKVNTSGNLQALVHTVISPVH